MAKSRSHVLRILIKSGLTGIVLTLLSFYIHRKSELSIAGNMCGKNQNELCYAPALSGGWPWIYVKDNLEISVINHLSIEDIWNFGHLFYDIVFFTLLAAAYYFYRDKTTPR